jgi:hypothetical protein
MNMFWIGFVVGIFIGTNVAIVVVALCVSAKRGDMQKQEK